MMNVKQQLIIVALVLLIGSGVSFAWWSGHRFEISQFFAMEPLATPTITPVLLDVKNDCGAVGDGITDDTAAIQKCIDMVYAKRIGTPTLDAVVYLPAGTYYVTRQEQVWDDTYESMGTVCPADDRKGHYRALYLKSGVTLRGAGSGNTTIAIVKNGQDPYSVGKLYAIYAGVWYVGGPTPAMASDCATRKMTMPENVWDYKSNWQEEGRDIAIENLKLVGSPEAENAAIVVQHGYNVNTRNIILENWYRGLKFTKSPKTTVENSFINNTRYIGIALYANHLSDRTSGVVSMTTGISNNTISNTDNFIKESQTRYGKPPSDHGVYFNGNNGVIAGNTFGNAGIYLDFASYVNITNNTITGAVIPLRLGYLPANRGGSDLLVEGNNIKRSAVGIVVNGAKERVMIRGNKLSDFVDRKGNARFEYFLPDTGRELAGINIEDSYETTLKSNVIEGLRGDVQVAGIRMANSRLNLASDCYSATSPLNGIITADNIVSFAGGFPKSIGLYIENVINPVLRRNTIGGATRLINAITYNSNIIGNVWTMCTGPSAQCNRRLTILHPMNPQTTVPQAQCKSIPRSPYDETW